MSTFVNSTRTKSQCLSKLSKSRVKSAGKQYKSVLFTFFFVVYRTNRPHPHADRLEPSAKLCKSAFPNLTHKWPCYHIECPYYKLHTVMLSNQVVYISVFMFSIRPWVSSCLFHLKRPYTILKANKGSNICLHLFLKFSFCAEQISYIGSHFFLTFIFNSHYIILMFVHTQL